MQIRRMVKEDVNSVAMLEAAAFSTPWSEQSFIDSMNLEAAVFLVATENDSVVGYMGCYFVGDTGEVTTISVAESCRRQGVGESLVREMIRVGASLAVNEIYLEVRVSNQAAISLYEKCGFTAIGTRKNFYEKPREDACVMSVPCG